MNRPSVLLKLYGRARALLPAEVQTVGLLAPSGPVCWSTSPFSCLPLQRGRQGGIGLRLAEDWAADVRRRGGMERLRQRHPNAVRYLPWRALAAQGTFWCNSEDGRLALLLDTTREVAWLYWQELTQRRST